MTFSVYMCCIAFSTGGQWVSARIQSCLCEGGAEREGGREGGRERGSAHLHDC